MKTAELYEKAIQTTRKYLDLIDEQNSKIIIVLDDDEIWLDIVKKKTKHDQNIITISDTKEFRSFILQNGVSKMYIDINMGQYNGIDLAEKLRLDSCFGDLVFMSSDIPKDEELERIHKLSGEYIPKSQFLEKIAYPRKGE